MCNGVSLLWSWTLAAVSLGALGGAAAQGSPGKAGAERAIEDGAAWASFVLAGNVREPDGTPAQGAVVSSSAGGQAVTSAAGAFRLEVVVPVEALEVQITAVGANGLSSASTVVACSSPSGRIGIGTLHLARRSTCTPSWVPTFGSMPGANGTPLAWAVFDDGSGPAVYAGGDFTKIGGTVVSRIARFDGSSWTSVGGGVQGSVRALEVFDDGSGPALCAAGSFQSAGGVAANRIAKWDGSSWTPLGNGFGATVNDLVVFDNGSGPALYAGGNFTNSGGTAMNRVSRWNGTRWVSLGGLGGGPLSHPVHALAVFDDGSGPALFVGGESSPPFPYAPPGGQVAKWRTSWSFLETLNSPVTSMAVFDDGGGAAALYVGGDFTTAGAVPVDAIARWDGLVWTSVDVGTYVGIYGGPVQCLTVHDDGSGPALYAGGSFTAAGNVEAHTVAKWNGSAWSAVGGGLVGSATAFCDVLSLGSVDDGSGPSLFAGGCFLSNGSTAATRVARWDGSSWMGIGGVGLDGFVHALAVSDHDGEPALYVGGEFTTVGGTAATGIARWDGASWSPLGDGLSSSYPAGTGGIETVLAVTTWDDGSGEALYVGGDFDHAGSVAMNHVAKWDGATWSGLGSGMTGGFAEVGAFAVYDDGSGEALYAAGAFDGAGGLAAKCIAKWNGSSWSPLGSGMTYNGCCTGTVQDLAVYDDGTGPALYAGGVFTIAGGVPANRIAKWNGSSWSALGSGMTGSGVRALGVFDVGGGPAVFAGGSFATAGGVAANNVAKWTGSGWVPLAGGLSPSVAALAVFDDGTGPGLFAGGSFTQGAGDTYLAKWGCPDTTAPLLSCPSAVFDVDRFGSPPGEVVSFSVTATDAHDPAPNVVCVPPSGSFFPRGTTLVSCTATDADGNQSTCQFPVTVQLKVAPGQR